MTADQISAGRDGRGSAPRPAEHHPDRPYRFDYSSLPSRRPTAPRPLYLDIEEANRRDARAAGELASPPVSTATGSPIQPWHHPTPGDAA